MAAKTIHIEVCDQIIKVCRIERKGKGVRVAESFTFRTPDDCVSDGVIANPQVLGRELRKQLTEHRLHHVKNVVFTLSSSKIAVREIKLPYMKEKLLAKAIQTNAEDYIPVDLKNYHLTHTVLETVSGPNAFMRIMVLAAPISMLEGYFELAEITNLTIKEIDSSGNSQYQALKATNIRGGVSIYVDVNSTSSTISFIRDGNLLLQRIFAFGADELIAHYISATGKSTENYLSALHETDITSSDFYADKVLSVADIQEDLNRLVSGIVRTVDFYNSSQWENAASRVVLMGSNRHIVGLREMIADATGLETIYLDDIPEFMLFTKGSSHAAAYVSCIGSALAPLHLIPPILQPSRRHSVDNKDATILPGVIIFALFALGSAAFAFYSYSGYHNAVEELENTKQEISNLEYTEQVYESYISYQKGEDAVKLVAAEADTPNAKLVSFFEELEEKMPSSILILSATCTNDGVSMNITVANFTDAATVLSELRSFSSLSSVEISSNNSSEDEAGVARVSFTVSCKYGVNPYLNGINPYSSLVLPSTAPSDTSTDAPTDSSTGESAATSSDLTTGTESASPVPSETQTQG